MVNNPLIYVFAGNHQEYVTFCRNYDVPQSIVKFIDRKEQLIGLRAEGRKLHVVGTAPYRPDREEILGAARYAGFQV